MDFYKQKDFGQLIGAPFIFFGKEVKTISFGLLIFIGPFILVKSVLIGYFGVAAAQDFYTQIQNLGQGRSGTSFFIQIFEFFQNVMLYTFVGAYVKIVVTKGSGNIDLETVWAEMKRFYWPFAGGLILSGIIIVIGFILIIFPGIYLAVALFPLFAIIIFEENGVSKSISRSFELIKGNWWLTFGLVVVMFIIIVTASAVLYLITGTLFGLFGGGSLQFALSNLTESAIEVIISLFMILTPFFLYGHLISLKEQPDLINRISEISENETDNSEIEVQDGNSDEETDEQKLSEKNRFTDNDDTDRFKPKY